MDPTNQVLAQSKAYKVGELTAGQQVKEEHEGHNQKAEGGLLDVGGAVVALALLHLPLVLETLRIGLTETGIFVLVVNGSPVDEVVEDNLRHLIVSGRFGIGPSLSPGHVFLIHGIHVDEL